MERKNNRFYVLMILLPLLCMFGVKGAVAQQADSLVMMQLVPDEVPAGKEFTALIQVKNTGATVWSRASGVKLETLNIQPWDVHSVSMPKGARTAPGDVFTFKPKIMAPLIPGEYELQWQMKQGARLFGMPTEPVMVRVTGALIPFNISEFVYQKVPTVMGVGEAYTITMQFKNVGDTVWTPGQFSLVTLDDSAALTWAVESVDIKTNTVVPPGGFQTFRFDVVAPSEPGTYSFEWKMKQKGVGVFGKPSKRVDIKVVEAP